MNCCVWLLFFSITFVKFIHLVLLIVDHSLFLVCSSTVLYFLSVCEVTPTFPCVCIHVKARRQSWMDVIPHVPFICFETWSLTGLELANTGWQRSLCPHLSSFGITCVCHHGHFYTHRHAHSAVYACKHITECEDNLWELVLSFYQMASEVKLGFKCPMYAFLSLPLQFCLFVLLSFSLGSWWDSVSLFGPGWPQTYFCLLNPGIKSMCHCAWLFWNGIWRSASGLHACSSSLHHLSLLLPLIVVYSYLTVSVF